MKIITIVRHGKSSWKNQDSSDFERTLNKRGERDAPFMASLVKEMNIKPDLLLSSPAVRAVSTANYFADTFGINHDLIRLDNNIYDGGPKFIIEILKNMDDKINNLILFGHNPDLTYLSSYLSGEYFDNVPTCGVVSIDLNISKWREIDNGCGKLKFFEYPKKYFKND